MIFEPQLLAEAVEYGLVLPYQWIATGVGAAFIDSSNRESSKVPLTPANRGRPLTDSVLTALSSRYGPTDEGGPMAPISVHIITQGTARLLWTLTAATRTPDECVQALTTRLPYLLKDPSTSRETAHLLAAGWRGSLDDLVSRVADVNMDAPPPLG
jgi:hypothetical protein